MGLENIDYTEELKRLDQDIESATELAALKPIYFRLNEIMQASPGDFDVQFTGNELKQRLMARGTVLKQQGISAPAAATPPPPPPLPATEDVEAPAQPAPLPDAAPPAPFAAAAPSDPALAFGGPSAEYPLFPLFAAAPPPPLSGMPAPPAPFAGTASPPRSVPEPPASPAYFAETMPPPPAARPEPTGVPTGPWALTYRSSGSGAPQPDLPALNVTPEEEGPEPPTPGNLGAPTRPWHTPFLDATPPASKELPGALPYSSRLAALFESTPAEPLTSTHAAAPTPPLADAFEDDASSAPPAPALPETPENPPAPPVQPPARPRAAFRWNHPLVIGPIAGLLIALAVILLVVRHNRVRDAMLAARNRAAVQVEIATTPPGAVVKVVGQGSAAAGIESTCTANCKLSLAPGIYEFTAALEGFEPATGVVTVRSAQPASVSLTLQPQALSVRLLTDLPQGKVVMDDRPPVDLQDGQLVLDKVAAGTHKMKIVGPNGDASFSFAIADAQLPAVSGPVNARNMVAILVASFGKQARIVTNAGPWKLAVNGQSQSDAGPAGTDVTSFQPGVNEVVVGEGNDRRNMSESFGAAPTLTAFLKTDVNAGTLIVSTGLDDVRVLVNNKEYKLRTQHGKLRIQTLGKVSVRVAKSGFQDEPEQTAEVKKGAEVRLQFDMKPQPQFGSLEIHGAIAGTEVLVDQRSAGTVGPDGLFSVSAIQPGEHTIELRREQRLPKRLQRSFRAGQTVSLAAADVALATANGTLRVARIPASATITYRRSDEREPHEIRGSQVELPAGTYYVSASAPGFTEASATVQLTAGENRAVDFNLTHERPAAPVPMANAMAQFQDAQSWTKDGDSWVHKGGGFVPFRPAPKGLFTFNVELVKGGGVFRAGAIRWCLQYVDPKNYLLFELDRKNFRAWVIKEGQRLERVPKTPHNLGNQKSFTIQIDVTADRLLQKVRGGETWKTLDTFSEPGRDFTQGKFGFLIQGNDEIAISDFQFVPR